ncbi:MAG: AmmeMemoRadiSam system protein A [Thermoanaerobaculia bacterium]|nr:AmmeMemoRadiSam system protein A [Thermoanaerobaculia bacterium]
MSSGGASPMGDRRGVTALALARAEIAHRVAAGPAPRLPSDGWLERPGASFVTLTRAGRLRGCIGTVLPHRPLGEDLLANARAAALEDPRFPPVAEEELDELRVEVSVLSPLTPLEVTGEEDLRARLRPGRDGLYLEGGLRRATFLPQVWRSLPEPADFVAALRSKAGLGAEVPAEELRWWTFTVEKWAEREGDRPPRTGPPSR